jgi:hypothetical protein
VHFIEDGHGWLDILTKTLWDAEAVAFLRAGYEQRGCCTRYGPRSPQRLAHAGAAARHHGADGSRGSENLLHYIAAREGSKQKAIAMVADLTA